MYGGIADAEAAMAALETALEVEEAFLDQSTLLAAFLDYSKFFDILPWELLWPLALHWGAPWQIINAMKAFYIQLTSAFKIGNHFGPEWRRVNSIAQGCPLSIMWANMVGALWAKVLSLEVPDVRKNVFVDDKSLRTNSRMAFERAFVINEKFDKICGQNLNWKKVFGFACRGDDQNWMRNWSLQHNRINEVKSVVTLGHQISVSSSPMGKREGTE